MGGETKASPDPPELVLHCCVFLLEKRGWVRGWCWRGWDGSIPAVSATGGFHSRTGKCCVTSPGLMGHLEVQALTVTKTITETNCPWATLLVLTANTVSPTSGSPVSESHVGLEGRKIPPWCQNFRAWCADGISSPSFSRVQRTQLKTMAHQCGSLAC